MKKPGQYILLSKKLEIPKVSNISQMLHIIPSIDNPMRYSFEPLILKVYVIK